MKFSYDGFGINDASDPYCPRLLTFARNTPDQETIERHDRIGNLLVAAPDMLEALKGLLNNAPAPKHIRKDYAYTLYLEAAKKAVAKAEGAKKEDTEQREADFCPDDPDGLHHVGCGCYQ